MASAKRVHEWYERDSFDYSSWNIICTHTEHIEDFIITVVKMDMYYVKVFRSDHFHVFRDEEEAFKEANEHIAFMLTNGWHVVRGSLNQSQETHIRSNIQIVSLPTTVVKCLNNNSCENWFDVGIEYIAKMSSNLFYVEDRYGVYHLTQRENFEILGINAKSD